MKKQDCDKCRKLFVIPFIGINLCTELMKPIEQVKSCSKYKNK